MIQNIDCPVQVHADTKLEGIFPHKLSYIRRKQSDDDLNSIELFHYNSANGSIGFVGAHASPFVAFASIYLQKRRNCAKVRDIAIQSSMLKRICELGSISSFKRPTVNNEMQLSVLVFCDVARPSEYGQLGNICGILIGPLQKGSIFHALSWISRLSKRPSKSISSAETLAAGSGIDEGMLIASGLAVLLGAKVPVIIAVDSKDLFDSLTSCHVP